ncbi:hypothetical protein GCM10007392_13420 [Saccharospirillum salsuginis]|uniref:Uncharacterized protein n=1 Tax=Saccharospirillum salsuginis TaxID=418750 RepID=A0A918N7M3_9GAMM|nr:hypothetical protein GCM10007392_13420 [Saccharospirillum salsuginis]
MLPTSPETITRHRVLGVTPPYTKTPDFAVMEFVGQKSDSVICRGEDTVALEKTPISDSYLCFDKELAVSHIR